MPDLSCTSAYDYALPPDRIARYPADQRDGSRLLVMCRDSGSGSSHAIRDRRFSDLVSLVRPDDLLVVNESRVLPVRLLGRKPTGAKCEVLLLRPAPVDRTSRADAPNLGPSGEADGRPSHLGRRWEALVRPGSKLKPGRRLIVASDLEVRIEEGLAGGGRIVYIESEQPVEEALEAHGRIPLPPYIDRIEEPMDRERYQTVYARDPGSVAAPTAGLHFTSALMESLELRGVQIARVSLHVGPGTFRPVSTHSIDQHRLDPETWHIPVAAADAIRATRGRGGRVWGVGTTVVRTLETAAREDGTARQGDGSTGLFITPGFRFRVVDALITNFHLPRSTLLMLVAAFAGYEATMRAYDHAVRTGYRFYSYGDAMAVLPAG